MNIRSLSLCLFCVLTPGLAVWSQSPLTEHTFQLDDQAKSPSAEIKELSWLHGFWIGEGLGGQVDECWSVPAAGTMVGTFRLIKNNQIEFSEFIEISQRDGSLVLKVKHFDRELIGWEAKDKFAEFALVKLDDKTAIFDGLTYMIDEQDNLRAYVAMKQKDGTVKEGSFVFHRQSSSDLSNGEVKRTFAIELPDDPEAVILTYDTVGGYRAPTPADFEPTPLFRLLANGKVLVGRNNPSSPELEYQMTKEELNTLLDDVVNKKRVFDITTDELKKQIEETGKSFRLIDAPTHRFSINLANAQHEVESYGLTSIYKTYKEVEDLQALTALQKKFMFYRSRAALGPQAEVDKLLEAMTKKYKKRFSTGNPLTLEHLTYANVDKNGNIDAQFTRVEYENDLPEFIYHCFVRKRDGKLSFDFARSLIR